MKKLLIIAIAAPSLFVACKKEIKDDNTIQGTVTYVRPSGTEYTANSATVILYSGTGSSKTKEETTTTSLSGHYKFDDLKDGAYTIFAEGTYTSVYYYGQKTETVAGDDDKTVDIKMY